MNRNDTGSHTTFEQDYWRSKTSVAEPLPPLDAGSPDDDEFRILAENIPTLCWIANGDGYIVWYNRRWHEYCGTTPEQMEGWGWQSVHDSDQLPEVMARWQESIATGEPFEMTFPLRGADGIFRPFLTRIQPVRNGRGEVSRWFGVNTEIAKQKQAEKLEHEARSAHEKSLEQQAAILGQLAEGVIVANTEGRILFVNEAAERLHGVAKLDITPSDYSETYHLFTEDGDPYPPEELPLARAVRNGETVTDARWRIRRPDGIEVLAIGSARPLLIGGGQAGAILTLRDDTARVAAENALRASEQRFRMVFENAAVGMLEVDADWNIRSANRVYSEIAGYPLDELLGMSSLAFTHPDDIAASEQALRKVSEPGTERTNFEKRYIRKDGRIVWVRSNLSRTSAPGEPLRLLKVVEDITAIRETRDLLEKQRRTLETLNRSGSALAGELDLERLVQMVTDAGVELTGAQFGAFFYNVFDTSGESYLLFALSGAERSDFEKFGMPRATSVFKPTFDGEGVVRSDDILRDPRYGKNRPHNGMPKGHLPVRSYLAVPVVSRSGEVIGGLFFGHPEPARFHEEHEELMTGIAAQAAVAIDNARLYQSLQVELAERKRVEGALRDLNETLEQKVGEEIERRSQAEDALRQAQKMETLGQLTGGIAHDFNNLLQVIAGNLDILRRKLPEESPRLERAIENAMTGANRAATLTQRLLAFSRRQPLEPKPVDLSRLIAAMSQLLHRTLGEQVEIETVLAPRLWPVEVDPNQLENAILNLAVNARDAMRSGGKLTIETQNTMLDTSYALHFPEVEPGQYVVICISDTGVGMDSETIAKAVEPFFTTKEVGKGTGLGLSMVYGFVKQSGGHLRVYSEPDEGTTVKIYLPRQFGAVIEEAEQQSAPEREGSGDETILVCEDDDDVRAFSVEILRELGYRVLEAHDGPSALRLFERQEGPVHLLFSDVVLPGGISGAQLAEKATELRPDIRVLFTTGYARNAIVHHGRLDPGVDLITKPFSVTDLADRVRAILDRPTDSVPQK